MFNEEDQELYALIFGGPMLLMGLLGGVSGWIVTQGQVATAWLIQHHILVPADQAVIPILDAGMDLPRCVLLVTVLILMVWGMIAGARRRRERKA